MSDILSAFLTSLVRSFKVVAQSRSDITGWFISAIIIIDNNESCDNDDNDNYHDNDNNDNDKINDNNNNYNNYNNNNIDQ